MSVILIFVDGIGIGTDDKFLNPCCRTNYRLFDPTNSDNADGKIYGLDAQLGVPGYPQSATGQTSIYCGTNAPALIEKHLTGFPNQILKNILHKKSIFQYLLNKDLKCVFLNAYRPVFFTTPELFHHKTLSATGEMNRGSHLNFNQLADINEKRALYHDYSNMVLIRNGFNVPEYNASDAAAIILNNTKQYDLILYEYFLTDYAGHGKDMVHAVKILNIIEKLIIEVKNRIIKSEHVLMVVSDHGNIEDMSTKSHTLNPAYCGIWGAKPDTNPDSITDIFEIITSVLIRK